MELTPEEKCLLSSATQAKIIRNIERCRNYERILRKIRRNIWNYDAASEAKAHRVIAKIKAICDPAWKRQGQIANQRRNEMLLFRTA